MKDKILVFIIGLLIGGVITASGFLIYEKINTNQVQNERQMKMMEPPNGEKPDGETPPEKPSGTESDENRPELPSKKDSSTSNKSN